MKEYLNDNSIQINLIKKGPEMISPTRSEILFSVKKIHYLKNAYFPNILCWDSKNLKALLLTIFTH